VTTHQIYAIAWGGASDVNMAKKNTVCRESKRGAREKDKQVFKWVKKDNAHEITIEQ